MFGKRRFIFRVSVVGLLFATCFSIVHNTKPSYPLIQQLTAPVTHGEGPHWDSEKNVLFFVDIYGQKVYRYDPSTKKVTFVDVGDYVSPIIPVENTENKFIIGLSTNLALLTWNGQNITSSVVEILDTIDANKPGNRFNDGKSDAAGRLWIGTMGPENASGYIPPSRGTLFKATNDVCKLEPIIPNVSISNGLAWSLDNQSMFYIDSNMKRIDKFDYDILTGSISNQRILLDFNVYKIKGIPDGMTIDNNGNLWVACYDGSQIICVNSTSGEVIYVIEMPVEKVTSVTFGGAYFDILYVTTSKNGLNPEKLAKQPAAGALFSISNIVLPSTLKSVPVVGHYNVPVSSCAMHVYQTSS